MITWSAIDEPCINPETCTNDSAHNHGVDCTPNCHICHGSKVV